MTEEAGVASGAHVKRGVLCALLGGVFWGFSGVCAQLLMSGCGVSALWITCVRTVVSAACFLTVSFVCDRQKLFALFRDVRSLIQIAGFALLGVLLTQISYLSSIAYVGAGTGTALEQTGLALIMLYACVRGRRLPRVREVVGLVCALSGVFVLATQGDASKLAVPFEGLAWGFVAAVALMFYTLMPVRALQKWGAFPVTGVAMLFAGVVSVPIVQPWTMPVEITPAVIAGVAAIVVVGTVGAYSLYLQGIKDAGPVKASLLASVEPVSALVISAVWLQVPVTSWDALGCAAIVVMVFLVTGVDSRQGRRSSMRRGKAKAAVEQESAHGLAADATAPLSAPAVVTKG